jgi:hypothetical protein
MYDGLCLRIFRSINYWVITAGMILPAILLWSRCAIAQVTSDGTTNIIVNPSGNNRINCR